MNKKIWFMIVITIITILGLIGCNVMDGDPNEHGGGGQGSSDLEKVLSIDPEPRPEEQDITLYFKHEHSDYLIPEIRKAVRDKQSWEQLVVEELFKGPRQHERVSIMPPGVRVLDVTRNGETVFVNLSQEFTEDINLYEIPGMEDIPEDKRAVVQAEMKRLGMYSIVNSLTELEGVNKVKFLVETRAISCSNMDDELQALMFSQDEIIDPDKTSNAVLVSLSRDRSFNLSPEKSVSLVFQGMVGEPNWDNVYPLLAKNLGTGKSLPEKEELERLWSVLINGIELDNQFIIDEEVKVDGRVFVTASYTVSFVSGKKDKMERDKITVLNENDIWKVKLPGFMSSMQ